MSSVSNEDITEVGNDWQIMLSHTLYKDQGFEFGAGQIWHYSGHLYNYKKAPAPTFRNSGSGSRSDKERLEPADSGFETLLRIMKKKNGFLIIRIDICKSKTLIY